MIAAMRLRMFARTVSAAALVAGVGLMLGPAAALACPEPSLPCVSELDPHQWRVINPQASTSEADYALYNWAIGGSKRDLIDHHRTFGADLEFGNGEKVSTGLRQFSFKRASGKPGPITAKENVAIYDNFTHKYLVNAHQRFGVDLNWVAGASYEWRIIPGTTPGSVGLYDTRRRDYLVFGEETFGINLEWYTEFKKTTESTPYAVRSATVTLRASSVEEGFVPFSASFGGGVGVSGETLRGITNPFNNVTILVVREGHNTNQCNESSAVVALGPSATLGGPQLTEVYGSPTPPLPINIVACVVASANVTSVPLNVSYFGPA
jgi:hypothetical protein